MFRHYSRKSTYAFAWTGLLLLPLLVTATSLPEDSTICDTYTVQLQATFENDTVIPCSDEETTIIEALIHSLVQTDAIVGLNRIIPVPPFFLAFEKFGHNVKRLTSYDDRHFRGATQMEIASPHLTTEDHLEDMYYDCGNNNETSNDGQAGHVAKGQDRPQKEIEKDDNRLNANPPKPPPPIALAEGSLRKGPQRRLRIPRVSSTPSDDKILISTASPSSTVNPSTSSPSSTPHPSTWAPTETTLGPSSTVDPSTSSPSSIFNPSTEVPTETALGVGSTVNPSTSSPAPSTDAPTDEETPRPSSTANPSTVSPSSTGNPSTIAPTAEATPGLSSTMKPSTLTPSRTPSPTSAASYDDDGDRIECNADWCAWFITRPCDEIPHDPELEQTDRFQRQLEKFEKRVQQQIEKKLRKWARDSDVMCLGNSWQLQATVKRLL